MEDNQILDLYFARDQQAVAETDKKYGGYCMNLAGSILNNDQDAEEVVSDTYLKTWNAIPPSRPQVFRMFLAKITRNLAYSRWRKLSAEKRGGGEMDLVLEELSECIGGPGRVEDRLNGRELARTIRTFLDTLPRRDQNIFLRRYFYVEESGLIAARYAMKQAAVQKVLLRTRTKLKEHLQKEGYDL